MSESTSFSLLNRLRNSGDAEAWQRLVTVYRPLLAAWLRRFDVQASDVDDLAQEVMMVVMRELQSFQHNERQGAFRSWLRTILVHRLREFWRSRNYRPLATGNTDFQQQLNELADGRGGITEIWEREHDEFVMKKLLETVEPQFEPQTWQAFRWQVIDGLRADRVAAELGMKPGAGGTMDEAGRLAV